jgi:hypothetical protein
MSFFRELPNLQYQSFTPNKKSSLDYITVKNLFRRVKLRDDLQNVFTLFNKYEIPDGARPDTVAEELYGKADYDWVVLLSSNILNARDGWPLSDRDVYRFAENKYGLQELNEVKFYETTEVKDSQGRLILPRGKVVDSNFKISYLDNGVVVTNDLTALGENVRYIQDPFVGVSNYEYEVRKNNEKRSIYLLKPQYLQQYLNDFRTIMHYEKSTQYVNSRLIKTENTRNTSPP